MSTTPTSTPSMKEEEDFPKPGLVRENSMQTRYMVMLLDQDNISNAYNVYASFFTWFLLAGFIILPSTFTSLSALSDDSSLSGSQISTILKDVKNIPLLYFAAFCSGIGTLGMAWLWFKFRKNYVWIINKIFLPGCLHSLAGFISTFVNVYSGQHGTWSVTAWATAAATGGAMLITGIIFAVYNWSILAKVKKGHKEEMDQFGKFGA